MSETEMKIDPVRAASLVSQLQKVQKRTLAVAGGREVRLVAVSKLKPANDILALHHDPTVRHEHFGENYAQELAQKADILPRSIKWHFIGGLQSGHCKSLAKIPNLHAVSSVYTTKHAALLEKHRAELRKSDPDVAPLGVHVQVNTSGEQSKSGCEPGVQTEETCRFIKDECPNLRLVGLMTIGAIARSIASSNKGDGAAAKNEDFEKLAEERARIEIFLEVPGGALELSMGMSEDFETAISMGSSEVRVGSTIFGTRPAKEDAKISV